MSSTDAARQANMGRASVAEAGNPRTGVASGRGIACVLYEGDNGYVALAAEVDVNQDTGAVRAKRIVVAQDVGPDLEPRLVAQPARRRRAAGPVRALGEEVTWDDQKITSVDWATYKTLYVGRTCRRSRAC
jgi:CO/xanthine dehydrogenase Mo-binding subunit